ncbi:MAG: hypothetical protein JNK87_34645 [Bryobacterales bacterium]|nr:hypothetical protein [Bryobacterales bacterium]
MHPSVSKTVSTPSIVFTSSGTNTALPYLFAGDSFTQIALALSNNDTTAGGQTIIASDLSDSGAGQLLLAGATLGLGRVFFDVLPTAQDGQSFGLTFLAFPTTSVVGATAGISRLRTNSLAISWRFLNRRPSRPWPWGCGWCCGGEETNG